MVVPRGGHRNARASYLCVPESATNSNTHHLPSVLDEPIFLEEPEGSTTPIFGLPFKMLRLVLDELADRLTAEQQCLSESDKKDMVAFASEFQQLCAKSGVANNPYEHWQLGDKVVRTNVDIDTYEDNPAELANEDRLADGSQPPDLKEWQEELVAIFHRLDADGSGSLSVDELRRALIEAGVPMARLTKLIKLADVNDSGEVEFQEWLKLIKSSACSQDLMALSRSLSDKCKAGKLFKEEAPVTHYALHPAAKVRLVFDILIFLICCYLGTVSPFVAAWEDDMSSTAVSTFERIDVVIMIFFIIDIILSFFTGYINADDKIVLDLQRVATHYLRTWFLLDVISTFPFDSVGLKGGQYMQMLKVLKLVKIQKMFSTLSIRHIDWSEYSSILDDLSTSKLPQMLLRRSTVLINLILLCHWMACGMKLVETEGTSFLKTYADVHGNAAKEYLAALYWAMTTLTTVGYGDISPTSDGERVYTILAMVVGGGFYGYVVGSICSMVSSSDLNSSAFYDRMELIHAWVNHHKLPSPMKRRIRRYFKIYLAEKSAVNEGEIWRDLTPEMQREVGEYIIQKDVKFNPLFDGLAIGTVVRLQSILQKISVPQGRIIVQIGEAGMAMYMLMAGALEQVSIDAQNKQIVRKLGVGQSFGEEILLGLAENYDYTVTTLEKTRMEMILVDDFASLFANMPKVVQHMRRNAIELNPKLALRKS